MEFKSKVEIIFVTIFLFVLLYFISFYEGGLIKHGSPYQLVAGDMFSFNAFGEVSKDENQYSFLPPYMAKGLTDAANVFPPTLGIYQAQLSLFTGAETYDMLLHLMVLFLIVMVVGLYLVLRKLDLNIAFTGIIIGLVVWKWPLSYIINWGASMSNLNFFFVIFSFVSFLYLTEKYMIFIFAVINAASFIAHGREFQTFNIAIVAFFFIQFCFKKIDWNWVKNYLISIPLTIVLLFRYVPIWRDFSEGAKQPGLVGTFFTYCPLDPTGYHYVSFSTLGLFKWIVILSIILIVIFYKKIVENKQLLFSVTFSLLYIVSSYFCIYGNKTTQIRHFYPIFLIPLIGIGIYLLFDFFKDSLKEKVFVLSLVVSILLIVVCFYQHTPLNVPEYPVSNPYSWEGVKFIQEHAEPNSTVVVLYGDNFYQETYFYLLKHPFYMVDINQYLKDAQSNILKPTLNMSFTILGNHYHRDSLFKLARYSYGGPNGENLKMFVGNLCDYDYVFTNKYSQNQLGQEYTRSIIYELINQSKFEVQFDNALMVILHNPNKGGACFNERRI